MTNKEKPFERETEYLQIAAQNNAIGTNYVQATIDKMQQNSRYRLCGVRDEIISECCKFVEKEYKTRHD